MRVIVVASQKGGSGKTTLAGHLAVQAERSGAGPVAIIDTDPQASLSEWWNVRKAETPLFARTSVAKLIYDLHRLGDEGASLVIIDTPPAITVAIRDVMVYADLVVVPTRPSPHDLRAVSATLDLVDAAKKPMVFVVNGATPRARITGEAAIALSQHGTVAPVTVHQRTVFASSMIDGRTVMELDAKSTAAQEIEQLWTYVQSRLAKVESPGLFRALKGLMAG
jgi:chromosome partitioning protein